MNLRNFALSAIMVVVSVVLMLGVGEVVLRVKNSAMTNYDIEMWRYARDLKFKSDNPVLGHDHIKNGSALLQSVVIRTDEWGLRGPPTPPRDPNVRRILFLGSSITLGWGVKEEDTETEQLRKMFMADGQKVEVLNAGIGNYNAERYVERFLTELTQLDPSDIVVQYFLRDAEKLDDGQGNTLLRNSELAVTLWIAMTRLTGKVGLTSLEEHYQSVYKPDNEGYQAMLASLRKLADYARAHHIRLYMAMTPDIHNLKDYPFSDIHRRMEGTARDDGYTFVDLLPAFSKLSPEQVWAMPGDPHPNALGHRLMAEAIYPVLRQDAKTKLGIEQIMLFSDPVFFVFFAVYFTLHFFLPARFRIWLIIAGSAVFYAWWRPAYVWLPFAMTFGAFAGAAWIDTRKEQRGRRLRLAATLFAMFLPLAFIKYAFFLANDVLGLHGAIDTAQLRWPLPLGLSFVTFTLSAYVIDVYRGKYPLEPSLRVLLGYVLFFPHLIAGPILRPHELMPQLRNPESARGARLTLGIAIFTMGLVKKLIFADTIAVVVDKVYQNGGSGFEHLIALYGFSVQIYCDFSGYTDMAIGLAYLLRVRLPTNFLRPYGALSIVDFWRRWHITLSHWLRDYLYIPLGGNRGGKAMQIRNILITMLLGGLWHGANWSFVIWGGLHGAALGFVHLFSRRTAGLPRWLTWLLTFHFVTFAWIFFRARDFASAQRFIAETYTSTWSTAGADVERNVFVVILIVVFALTHALDRHARLRIAVRRANPLFVWLAIAFCWMLAITISQGSSANFIYFDF